MPDPLEEHKRAFHYALQGWEDMSKKSLRELDSKELRAIIVGSGWLLTWTQEVLLELAP